MKTFLTASAPNERERMKRVTLVISAAAMTIIAAPVSHAGPWDDPSLNGAGQDYVNHFHNVVCEGLSADPSEAGLALTMRSVESAGFSHHEAAAIITSTVKSTCRGFAPLLAKIVDVA